MTREESKIYIKSKMCNGCSIYLGGGKCSDNCKVIEALEALEQEPKIGYWMYDDEYSDQFDAIYECSCCRRPIIVPYAARNEVYKDYPYCHCGTRMVESQKKKGIRNDKRRI